MSFTQSVAAEIDKILSSKTVEIFQAAAIDASRSMWAFKKGDKREKNLFKYLPHLSYGLPFTWDHSWYSTEPKLDVYPDPSRFYRSVHSPAPRHVHDRSRQSTLFGFAYGTGRKRFADYESSIDVDKYLADVLGEKQFLLTCHDEINLTIPTANKQVSISREWPELTSAPTYRVSVSKARPDPKAVHLLGDGAEQRRIQTTLRNIWDRSRLGKTP